MKPNESPSIFPKTRQRPQSLAVGRVMPTFKVKPQGEDELHITLVHANSQVYHDTLFCQAMVMA